MEKMRPPFARWKQKCLCFEATLQDLTAASFLLDEQIALDDRFEAALRILRPVRASALH